MPRAVDLVLSDRVVGPWRARAVAQVSGRVVEYGFGSGLNLPRYDDGVTEVLAVEPDDGAWEAATARIAAFGRPVHRAGRDAAGVDLPDGSADAVVATWTLCSIPDLAGALAEARRLLRPGGALHLVEHGRAPSTRVARAQGLLQPLWGRVSGGCHLDRDVRAWLSAAGFTTEGLTSTYAIRGAPIRPWTYFTLGRAEPALSASRRTASSS